MGGTDVSHLKPLLMHYDVHAVRVSPLTPGRFRVDTPSRVYEGRIVQTEAARVRMNVADYAAARQFRRTQRFLLTLYHDRFVPTENGQVFYLTPLWPGRSLDVTKRDVVDAVENLCRLHQSLAGFSDHEPPTDQPSDQDRCLRWVDSLDKGAKWLGVERVLGRDRGTGGSQVRLYEWLDKWEELAHDVTSHMRSAGYEDVAKVWSEERNIAWNQYRLANLTRLPDGRIATLQTSEPVRDTKLYDLASLCQEICTHGQADGVVEAVLQYEQKAGLRPEERAIIFAYAAYPHLAFSTVQQVRKTGAAGDEDWVNTAELQYSSARKLLKEL